MSLRTTSTLAALTVLTSLLAIGCGSDLEQRDTASLTCEAGCDGVFTPPIRPGANQPLDITFRNFGDNPARIVLLELANAAPEISFNAATANNISRYSDEPWEFEGAQRHRVEPAGTDAFIPGGLAFSTRLLYEPNGNNPPQCPETTDGSCGTLRVHTRNAGVDDNVIEIPLRLQASSGQLVVSPDRIDFPEEVVLGRRYTADQQVTVQNTGTGILDIVSYRFQPEIPGLTVAPIGVTPGGEGTIQMTPGNTVRFSIEWTPREGTVPLNTELVIDTSAQDGTRRVRVASGGASQPEIALLDEAQQDLRELIFPALGSEGSAELNFTIENRGASNLNWSFQLVDILPSGARSSVRLFDADGPLPANPDPITPGNGLGLRMVYEPATDQASQSLTGTLRIQSNDGVRPSINVPIAAGPAQPLLNVFPSLLFWGAIDPGTSETRTLELRNIGRADAVVSELEMDGAQVGFYALEGSAPITIPPGEVRTLEVTYSRPADPLGAFHQANLRVTYNNPTVPTLTVTLTAAQDETLLPPSCVITAQPAEPYAVGQNILLSATQSSSNRGGTPDINGARWSVTGPGDTVVLLSASVGATTSFSPEIPGTYTARMALSEGSVECQTSRTLTVTDR